MLHSVRMYISLYIYFSVYTYSSSDSALEALFLLDMFNMALDCGVAACSALQCVAMCLHIQTPHLTLPWRRPSCWTSSSCLQFQPLCDRWLHTQDTPTDTDTHTSICSFASPLSMTNLNNSSLLISRISRQQNTFY